MVAPDTAVLIPVKAFVDAKARLASALGPAERAQLAETMATTVVHAAPVAVAVAVVLRPSDGRRITSIDLDGEE
ncbi:MAG: hypothetical protein ACKOIA_00305, partial [Acidimicrobiia bacterium]